MYAGARECAVVAQAGKLQVSTHTGQIRVLYLRRWAGMGSFPSETQHWAQGCSVYKGKKQEDITVRGSSGADWHLFWLYFQQIFWLFIWTTVRVMESLESAAKEGMAAQGLGVKNRLSKRKVELGKSRTRWRHLSHSSTGPWCWTSWSWAYWQVWNSQWSCGGIELESSRKAAEPSLQPRVVVLVDP